MAADEFTSPAGESREAAAEDSWEELLGRTGIASAPGEEPTAELGLARPEESERVGERASSPHKRTLPSLLARLGIAVALPVLAVALARLILPAAPGSDSAEPFHHAMSAGSTHRAIQPKRPPQAAALTQARARGRWVQRRKRVGARSSARRLQASHRTHRPAAGSRPEAEPIGPARAGLVSAPSVAPPPSHPAPESALGPGEPAPPSAGKRGGEGGLQDGSRSSAEFGL
jgi:hypothetical protein